MASENGHDGEVPGFSFSLIYHRLAAEPADNPKMTMHPEKVPGKAMGPGDGQVHEKTLLHNNHSTLAKHSSKSCGLNTPCQRSRVGNPHFPRTPTPHRGGVTEDQVGSWNLHPCLLLSLSQRQWRPRGKDQNILISTQQQQEATLLCVNVDPYL